VAGGSIKEEEEEFTLNSVQRIGTQYAQKYCIFLDNDQIKFFVSYKM
jgi:hypothetical protein